MSADTTSESDITAVIGVLGRLLHAPRSRPHEAQQRLELLTRLLASGQGWWRAEDLAHSRDEEPQLRTMLKELRRHGVLFWDERFGGYALHDHLRVPVALMILACSTDLGRADQLRQLDALLPFAQIAARGDRRAAPVWAMIDLLKRDQAQLDNALRADVSVLRDMAADGLLTRSAHDMRDLADRIAGIDDPDLHDTARTAVRMLTDTGSQVADVAVRMSRASRDVLRLPGSAHSASDLRTVIADLDDRTLADAVSASAGLAPCIERVPSEAHLAAHMDPLDDTQNTDRPQIRLDQLSHGQLDIEPDVEDARDVARRALDGQRSARMGQQLFSNTTSWQDALRLQHGLVRLHGELSRRGVPSWQPLADRVDIGGHVAWVSDIERQIA